MAIAWVGDWVSGQFNNNTGGTLTGRTSTTGNLAVLQATSDDNTATIGDNKGNTFTQWATGWVNDGSNAPATYLSFFYKANTAGGSGHTLSITTAAGHYTVLNATEYSGIATSSANDKETSAIGNSTSLSSGATATTTQADELVVGGGGIQTAVNTAFTAGSGFTMRGSITDGTSGGTGFIEDKIVSSTGAQTATATHTVANFWACLVITFKAAGGAVASPPVPSRARQRRQVPRTRARIVSPVPAQENPLAPARPNRAARSLRGYPVRRGRHAAPVPFQALPPVPPPFKRVAAQHRLYLTMTRRARLVVPVRDQPVVPLRPLQRRLWATVLRRGRLVMPVLTPPLPPPPKFISLGTQHRIWAGFLRRGRQPTPVPVQPVVPMAPIGRRPRIRRMHRSVLVAPPIDQTVYLQPPNRRPRIRRMHRGSQVTPVPIPIVVPVNPPYVSTGSQHRLWAPFLRRNRAAVPTDTQQPPVARLRAWRTRPTLLRRGTASTPLPVTTAPMANSGRRLWPPLKRRGRNVTPVPPPPVVINPPLPMKVISPRRLVGWLLRRARLAVPPWAQTVNIPPPAIVYPTAFELLDNCHLDFTPDPSGLTVELDASSLAFEVSPEETKFTIGESAENIRLG